MLTIGDAINWVEPKSNVGASDDYCVQCGRKLGKKPYFVEVSIAGRIMLDGKGIDNDPSQGCWGVGSECAKNFDPKVLIRG
jgi:hypothetical protein